MFNYPIDRLDKIDPMFLSWITLKVSLLMLLFYFKLCEAVQLHVGIPLHLCKFEKQPQKTLLRASS